MRANGSRVSVRRINAFRVRVANGYELSLYTDPFDRLYDGYCNTIVTTAEAKKSLNAFFTGEDPDEQILKNIGAPQVGNEAYRSFEVTLGIYGFWVAPRLQRWIVEHTDFSGVKAPSPDIE